MTNLKNKVSIVTGAALGIGAASAKELAQCGSSVTLMDINVSAAEEVAKEINDAGGRAHVVIADASSAKDCERTVTETVEAFGGLDILFNNVGIQPTTSYANVEDTTEEMWDQILAVNLKSRFLMAKYSIPHMRERGGGVIISSASVQGQQSAHLVPAYAATKGGDLSLTRQLALDYAKDNIRVLSVCPGSILTPLWRESIEGTGLSLDQAIKDSAAKHPIARNGEPEEIAKVVAFLASDDASFMTGTFVNVDGGMMAKGAWV